MREPSNDALWWRFMAALAGICGRSGSWSWWRISPDGCDCFRTAFTSRGARAVFARTRILLGDG
jgi:hypothetical protein